MQRKIMASTGIGVMLLLAGCSATLTPVEATHRPALREVTHTQSLSNFLSSYYADVGTSVPLADGRTLWFFGDTWDDVTGRVDRNSLVVQKNGTFIRQVGTFLQPRNPYNLDTWYWPGQAIAPDRDYVYLIAMQMLGTGEGAWDWTYLASDLITLRQSDLAVVSIYPLPVSGNGAVWSQIYYDRYTGKTYIYGSYPSGTYEQKAYDALVTSASLDRPYWTVKTDAFSPELNLGSVASIVRIGPKKYRLYTKELDMWTNNVIMYHGASPLGPWRDKRIVVTTVPPRAECWTYAVEAHPDILSLTYATNCGSFDSSYHLTTISMPI